MDYGGERMRLIDADALRREIDCCDFDSQTDKLTICQQISEAHTVDAVPVVRCRECTKRGTNNCPMEQNYPWTSSDSNGFCSYGVWREADHDGKEN